VTTLWIAVGVLGALLVAFCAGSFLLLAMGRVHLDLGWGRSLHELGPIAIDVAAPRELVFEVLSAPYVGRASGGAEVEVLARREGIAVAAHFTKVHFYTARTVEVVELDAPTRLGFRHLTGPVPHAVEQFELDGVGERTELRYDGEIGIDFFVLGRVAARYWVRPQWERTVRQHLEDVRRRAEQRADRQRARDSAQID
jgi:hypothetical protein